MCDEDEKYKQKYQLLASRCEAIQSENEQLARQVVKAKKNLRKARRLRMRLLQKLDEVGDPWRHGEVKGLLKDDSCTDGPGISSAKAQQQVFALINGVQETGDGKKVLCSASLANTDLECSPGGISSLPDLGNDSISLSEAATLVSDLNMASLPMPMLPMSVSPTPSPFADHDLLTGDSLATTIH